MKYSDTIQTDTLTAENDYIPANGEYIFDRTYGNWTIKVKDSEKGKLKYKDEDVWTINDTGLVNTEVVEKSATWQNKYNDCQIANRKKHTIVVSNPENVLSGVKFNGFHLIKKNGLILKSVIKEE